MCLEAIVYAQVARVSLRRIEVRYEGERGSTRVRRTATSFGDWLGLASWVFRSKCNEMREKKIAHKRMREVNRG